MWIIIFADNETSREFDGINQYSSRASATDALLDFKKAIRYQVIDEDRAPLTYYPIRVEERHEL